MPTAKRGSLLRLPIESSNQLDYNIFVARVAPENQNLTGCHISSKDLQRREVMPKGIYQRPSALKRFLRKIANGSVHPALGTPCWLWTGLVLKRIGGYGAFTDDSGKRCLVHRFSYKHFIGEIPVGMNICHHCDNPPCVNPKHLFVGDNAANAADRDAKGRQVIRKGEEFTHAKLTDNIVRDIRKRYTPRCPVNGARAMSREFGVSHVLIRWVVHRRIWKHVK